MSWSATYEIDLAKSEFKNIEISNVESEEHREQHDAALASVLNVLPTGSVGKITDKFRIYLTGHSNPNHDKTAGWANDFLSFTVTQL